MSIEGFKVHTGQILPAIGLGFWKLEKDRVASQVLEAASCGYRHFDCACDYGNEAEVGEGFREMFGAGICKREDLWVTSKLWNTYHRPEHVRPAAERSLNDLQLDYLDLYHIHFPISLKFVPFEKRYPPEWFYDPGAPSPRMEFDPVPYHETWAAMEELVDAGLVKHIGVCNIGTHALRDLLSYARIRPAVLQIELHPYLAQEKLLRFCREEGIAVTAFSPLGAVSYVPLGMAETGESVLDHQIIKGIAAAHEKTAAQIVLRWGVQRGTAVIPKTSQPERLKENIGIFDFQLSDAEMEAINALDQHRRFNDPGDFCEKAFNTFCPIFE